MFFFHMVFANAGGFCIIFSMKVYGVVLVVCLCSGWGVQSKFIYSIL